MAEIAMLIEDTQKELEDQRNVIKVAKQDVTFKE